MYIHIHTYIHKHKHKHNIYIYIYINIYIYIYIYFFDVIFGAAPPPPRWRPRAGRRSPPRFLRDILRFFLKKSLKVRKDLNKLLSTKSPLFFFLSLLIYYIQRRSPPRPPRPRRHGPREHVNVQNRVSIYIYIYIYICM